MEYHIKKIYQHSYVTDKNFSRFVTLIVIERQVEYHLLNTFLQTFLLHLVGSLTLVFRLDNFTDRIMVTLTNMLVAATLATYIQGVGNKTLY